MSLSTLPDDALARVCSYLHRRDREALFNTCKALHFALRPANSALWQDVHLNKFGLVTSSTRASDNLHLYEYAAESLCFKDAWKRVVADSLHAPVADVANNGRVYVAYGSRMGALDTVCDANGTTVNLPSRATAITACDTAVAVAWDRAVSVYKTDVNGDLSTTRPLRGHNATIRSAKFLGNGKILATGADDGTVRLHDVKSRRTRGVLRAHSGAVVQQQVTGDKCLLTRAGERVVAWDVNVQRAVKTYPGGKFFAGNDASVIYALAPGDACSIRVYDVRQEGVAAFLSLPRQWGRRVVGDFVLDADGGGVVAAIGEGGIVHWPAIGKLEGRSLNDPLRRPPVREPVICIRGAVAIASAAGLNCDIVSAALDRPFVARVPWPGREGGAFTQLLPVGESLLACREHEALLFDHRRKGAVIDVARAKRAVQTDEIDELGGGVAGGIGRFWQSSFYGSDDESEAMR